MNGLIVTEKNPIDWKPGDTFGATILTMSPFDLLNIDREWFDAAAENMRRAVARGDILPLHNTGKFMKILEVMVADEFDTMSIKIIAQIVEEK